jgi:hypothetical protein
VMTGWRVSLEYQAAGFFLSNAKGFSLNGCFCVFGLSNSPEFVGNSKVRRCKQRRIITMQAWRLKFFIAEDQASLVESNRKACLAQTGDE